jgi:hypothetical protein
LGPPAKVVPPLVLQRHELEFSSVAEKDLKDACEKKKKKTKTKTTKKDLKGACEKKMKKDLKINE